MTLKLTLISVSECALEYLFRDNFFFLRIADFDKNINSKSRGIYNTSEFYLTELKIFGFVDKERMNNQNLLFNYLPY